MSGPEHERVSAVADEAVRLVSALAGVTSQDRDDVPQDADQDSTAGSAGTDEARTSAGADEARTRTGPAACTCDAAAVQAVCQVCPVCRVAAFLAEVRPETVERVADVLGMVVGSLEAFAAQRRSEMAGSEPSQGSSGDERPPAPEAREWQPIQVEDEDGDA